MPESRYSATASLEDRKQRVISRREIEGMIADGRHIIIFDSRVLKVDPWIKFHPGGDKSIKHMVGRDATDEINAYDLCPSPALHRLTGTKQAALNRSTSADAFVSDWTNQREMEELSTPDSRREVSPIQQR
jgi:cytochrome b involved in lipid metabolism